MTPCKEPQSRRGDGTAMALVPKPARGALVAGFGASEPLPLGSQVCDDHHQVRDTPASRQAPPSRCHTCRPRPLSAWFWFAGLARQRLLGKFATAGADQGAWPPPPSPADGPLGRPRVGGQSDASRLRHQVPSIGRLQPCHFPCRPLFASVDCLDSSAGSRRQRTSLRDEEQPVLSPCSQSDKNSERLGQDIIADIFQALPVQPVEVDMQNRPSIECTVAGEGTHGELVRSSKQSSRTC